jgi:hypothetical protein
MLRKRARPLIYSGSSSLHGGSKQGCLARAMAHRPAAPFSQHNACASSTCSGLGCCSHHSQCQCMQATANLEEGEGDCASPHISCQRCCWAWPCCTHATQLKEPQQRALQHGSYATWPVACIRTMHSNPSCTAPATPPQPAMLCSRQRSSMPTVTGLPTWAHPATTIPPERHHHHHQPLTASTHRASPCQTAPHPSPAAALTEPPSWPSCRPPCGQTQSSSTATCQGWPPPCPPPASWQAARQGRTQACPPESPPGR